MAKTLVFLQERGLTDYDILAEKAQAAAGDFDQTAAWQKVIENRLSEISALQKHIGAYSKTREVYSRYRDSKWSKKFYAEHEADILLHRAAKKHFDSLGLTKLPAIQTLKTEYASLAAERKKLYSGYRAKKEEMLPCSWQSRTWIVCWASPQSRRKNANQTGIAGDNFPHFPQAAARHSRRQRRLKGRLRSAQTGLGGWGLRHQQAAPVYTGALLARARVCFTGDF